MPKFTYYDGNQGVHRFNNLNREYYNTTAWTAAGATMIYNGNDGPYDPAFHPYRAELTFKNAVEHTYETGPKAGDTTFIGGHLTAIRFYDDTGKLVMKVTGLKIDLSWLSADYENNNLWQLMNVVYAKGSTIYGSADSSGPSSDWDGDDIFTTLGNDKVYAKGGNDFITDLGGRDVYNGGGGRDTVSYEESYWRPELVKRGLKVDLQKGKITGFDGKVDTVKSIENVRGTFKNDKFYGDKKDNGFMGLGGNDYFNGRGGFDYVDYRKDADRGGYDGVKVNLKEGTARDGFGKTDTLVSIEGAGGTDFDDVFRDNKKDNYFRGRDGDDRFILTKGDDYVRGDDGADTFVFRNDNWHHDTIEDFDDTEGDKIELNHATQFSDLTIIQDGDNTVIEYLGNSITLQDFTATDLDAGDFIFV